MYSSKGKNTNITEHLYTKFTLVVDNSSVKNMTIVQRDMMNNINVNFWQI